MRSTVGDATMSSRSGLYHNLFEDLTGHSRHWILYLHKGLYLLCRLGPDFKAHRYLDQQQIFSARHASHIQAAP
jgi:hypothetical protein